MRVFFREVIFFLSLAFDLDLVSFAGFFFPQLGILGLENDLERFFFLSFRRNLNSPEFFTEKFFLSLDFFFLPGVFLLRKLFDLAFFNDLAVLLLLGSFFLLLVVEFFLRRENFCG